MPRFSKTYRPSRTRGPDRKKRVISEEGKAALRANALKARRASILGFLDKRHLCAEDYVAAVEQELGLTATDDPQAGTAAQLRQSVSPRAARVEIENWPSWMQPAAQSPRSRH